jgi:hypothetical protein
MLVRIRYHVDTVVTNELTHADLESGEEGRQCFSIGRATALERRLTHFPAKNAMWYSRRNDFSMCAHLIPSGPDNDLPVASSSIRLKESLYKAIKMFRRMTVPTTFLVTETSF